MITGDMERFWGKVGKGSDCWEWRGATNGRYGRIQWCGSFQYAHRVAWMIENGDVPEGLCVLHHCDNPLCVRIDHLFTGTQRDNMLDKERKGRGNQVGGEKHCRAKLTDEQVLWVRINAGEFSQRSMAKMFGVHDSTISRIQRGKRRVAGCK